MACSSAPSSVSPSSAVIGKRALEPSLRRVTIYFQDDAVRERLEETARQVLQDAMDDTSVAAASSNSTLLARKALKYRNVYARMEGVDVTSPTFNASTFLGVNWCKTQSLRAFYEAARS